MKNCSECKKHKAFIDELSNGEIISDGCVCDSKFKEAKEKYHKLCCYEFTDKTLNYCPFFSR